MDHAQFINDFDGLARLIWRAREHDGYDWARARDGVARSAGLTPVQGELALSRAKLMDRAFWLEDQKAAS